MIGDLHVEIEFVEVRLDHDRTLRLAMLANGLDRLLDPKGDAHHDVGARAPSAPGRVEELVDLRGRVGGGRIQRERDPLALAQPKQAVEQQCSNRAEHDRRAHDRLEGGRNVRGPIRNNFRRNRAGDGKTDDDGAPRVEHP